jgi:ComF family protein
VNGLERRARRLGSLALDAVFPRHCVVCARRLDRDPGLLLCPRCRGRAMRFDPRRSCRGCLRPLARGRAGDPVCAACRAAPPAYDRALAVWWYRPPIDAVLRAFKFGGLDFLGRGLADAALDAGVAGWLPPLDLVVPMPLAWPRRLRRGFNQAERFARPLARRLGLPLSRAIARRGRPRAQSRLGRAARGANAAQSFHARAPAALAGRRVLLVDDVLTTGATARAAAASLIAGGAARVTVLVAAWTPFSAAVGAPVTRLDSPCTRS